jgi:uncharacterized protein
MPIVSNTSPILNLSIIGLLDIIQKQFREVVIPQAVYDELKIDLDYPGVDQIKKALDEGWLKVISLDNLEMPRVLALELDFGESEAIALALEIDSENILLDEHEARSIAKQLGLKPIGIIGLILRGKRKGEIYSVKNVIDDLRKKAGFYVSEQFYQEVLEQAGE